jgi:two-component system chemotaxis response regulator CheB
MSADQVVVVGSSWGGLNALRVVLGSLPEGFEAAICVAQHRSAEDEDAGLAGLLDVGTALSVRDADDKDELRSGEVLLAPPGYHMLVEPGSVALSLDPPVRYSRPSIDVLFESAADAYRERTVGVVLTGANADGAAGLRRVHDRGGHALVQDPADAERPEMPRAALAAVPAAAVALDEIGPRLAHMVHHLAGGAGTP